MSAVVPMVPGQEAGPFVMRLSGADRPMFFSHISNDGAFRTIGTSDPRQAAQYATRAECLARWRSLPLRIEIEVITLATARALITK